MINNMNMYLFLVALNYWNGIMIKTRIFSFLVISEEITCVKQDTA